MVAALQVAATLAVLLLIQYVLAKLLMDPLRGVPGPFLNRFTTLVHKFHVMTGRKIFYIHALHQKFGPIVRVGPNELSISDPVAVRQIHKIGTGFTKTDWYLKFANKASPTTFSMVDPAQHTARRRLLSQAFSNSATIQRGIIIKNKIELCVSKIRRDAMAGRADILMWFTFMATDVIGQLCFGESFDMLGHEVKNEYVRDLETVMMISGIRAELPLLVKLAAILPIPKLRFIMDSQQRMHLYGRKALEPLYNSPSDVPDRLNVFTKMLAAKSNTLTQYDIEEEATSLIIAGSDTTAVTTTYIIWAIMKHPEVKEKLLTEIFQLPHELSVEDVLNASYLNQIIEEGLRLYGAAPGSQPRRVPKGGLTLAGHFCPEVVTVSTQSYTLHRDPLVFPDPHRFIPERWSERSQMMNELFMPFGGGSRVCLGMHLARLEMAFSIALLFKACPTLKLSSTTTDESMEFENHFLITPKRHRCEVEITGN